MQKASPSDRQVGLFGGSFNPPHVAHLVIAELICDQFNLDKILWIPNFQSPLKRLEDVAPANQRVEMTRLAIEHNDRFALNEVEVRRKGVSYTVETIRELQERHPDVTFHMIIGSDSLESFGAWHRPDEILERVAMIVFRRPGASAVPPPAGFEERVTFADAPLLEISGTTIRNRLHAGRSIRYMVPDPVHSYIFDNGLYSAPPPDPPNR